MKILILGQPRVGKTTLAEKIGKKYKLPVYHTDVLRKDLGYGSVSTNKHIFTTGIEIQYQKNFYDEIISKLPNDYVLEGSAIYPCDVLYFNPDAVVMLSAVDRSLEQMFQDSRKYDARDSYTGRRTDFELLDLFSIYKEFEENWYSKYHDIVPTINNMDYALRLSEAEAVIDVQIKKDHFTKDNSILGELFGCFKIISTLYSFDSPDTVYRRINRDNDICPEELYDDFQRLRIGSGGTWKQ